MNLNSYERSVKSAATYIRQKLKNKPEFGIVLGSGLGELADSIEDAQKIEYRRIPHFPTPTIEGHDGVLYLGTLKGVPIVGLRGRKHYYEVARESYEDVMKHHTVSIDPRGMDSVVFPVHVLAELGVPNYFVTNAAGGLNTNYNVGDVMIIKDHINMIPNALLGPQQPQLKRVKKGRPTEEGDPAWRFQPMNGAYNEKLRNVLKEAGEDLKGIHEGIYLATTGPTYETSAESNMFRVLGADAVGMSTTPEVIIARNRGMECVGFSCITNKIAKDGTNATSHEEVKAILESRATKDKLSGIVNRFFELYRLQ